VNKHEPQSDVRTATLFRDGDGQAVRIPAEFELEAAEVTIRKEGGRLVIEPKAEASKSLSNWAELLDGWEPLTAEEWPDIERDREPPHDIKLW
jgi:antitoxin VapB